MSLLLAFCEFATHTESSLPPLHGELVGMISPIAHSKLLVWIANSQKAHSFGNFWSETCWQSYSGTYRAQCFDVTTKPHCTHCLHPLPWWHCLDFFWRQTNRKKCFCYQTITPKKKKIKHLNLNFWNKWKQQQYTQWRCELTPYSPRAHLMTHIVRLLWAFCELSVILQLSQLANCD